VGSRLVPVGAWQSERRAGPVAALRPRSNAGSRSGPGETGNAPGSRSLRQVRHNVWLAIGCGPIGGEGSTNAYHAPYVATGIMSLPGRWITPRVLQHEDYVYKFRRRHPEAAHDLEREYSELLAVVRALPKYECLSPELVEIEGQVALRTRNVEHLGYSRRQWLGPLRMLRLLSEILQFSYKGIVHGDIRLDNVFWNGNRVLLIDFDQTFQAPTTGAIRANIVGPWGGLRRRSAAKRGLVDTLVEPLKKVLRASVSTMRHARQRPILLPTRRAAKRENASELREIWRAARRSDASAPGVPLAYYELTHRGLVFPGERPWNPRWETLRGVLDWKGKSVIEIGCNMGLLSTYLVSQAGASATVGLDHDPEIVVTARRLSRWMEASAARFEQLDLNRHEDLLRLQNMNADVVTVLNVLNWVAQPEEVVRHLPSAEVLLLEAHSEQELSLLASAGFVNATRIGITERDRGLYVLTKSSSSK
jgi:2-polyprenyl-3-methyl-5-hydroxy-6-metoxy-1,4-benzoquinol methylase